MGWGNYNGRGNGVAVDVGCEYLNAGFALFDADVLGQHHPGHPAGSSDHLADREALAVTEVVDPPGAW